MALELKTKLFLFGFVVLCSAMLSQADPMLCSRVYQFGGPSAMFHSPECSFLKSIDRGTVNVSCPAHSTYGLRRYQNLSPCTLRVDMSLPVGDKGTKEVEIIGSAVFSRNKGTEALETACHLRFLMNYFSLQTHLLAQEKQFTGKLDDDSFYLRLIEEGLIRTSEDANAIFSSEANQRELASASTVTITLSVNGHLLVANIGRPKTSVWSMKLLPRGEAKSCSYMLLEKDRNHEDQVAEGDALKFVESSGRTRLVFRELAKNHRKDGRTWIQTAFDLILDSICPPRGNHLFKSFQVVEDSCHTSQGSTSSPDAAIKVVEIMVSEDALTSQHLGMYQVIEKMNLRDTGHLVWEKDANINQKNSTAELLVSTVITWDYMGSMAAVVVPLQN